MNFAPKFNFEFASNGGRLTQSQLQIRLKFSSPARDNVPFSTLGMASGGDGADNREFNSRVDNQHDNAKASVPSGTFLVFVFTHSFRSSQGQGASQVPQAILPRTR